MTEAAIEIPSIGTEHHCRRGVADSVEETERCEIRLPILVHRADPTDRPRHNARGERVERQAMVILRRLVEHQTTFLRRNRERQYAVTPQRSASQLSPM